MENMVIYNGKLYYTGDIPIGTFITVNEWRDSQINNLLDND